MKRIRPMILISLLCCSGCLSQAQITGKHLSVIETRSVGLFTPSYVVAEAYRCDPATMEAPSHVCVNPQHIQTYTASQPGFLPSLFGSTIQAAGLAGAGYFIGEGLSESGTTVTQSGGGASASSHAASRSTSKATSSATSAQQKGRHR